MPPILPTVIITLLDHSSTLGKTGPRDYMIFQYFNIRITNYAFYAVNT